MKLLIDLSNHNNIYAGVTIYAQRLISGFVKNGYKNIVILCHPVIYKTISESFPSYTCLQAQQYKGIGIIGKVANAYLQGRQINSINCDVVFRPALSPSMFFTKRKMVQTIHDLQGLKINKGFKNWINYLFIGISIIRSRRIITISDFVKEDIKQYYSHYFLKKIETIYNSVIVYPSTTSTSPIVGSYLLYVSVLRDYKNLITLLKAYNMIQNQLTQKLIVIGRPIGDYLQKVILPYIRLNKLEKRVILITEPVSNDLLMQYYQHADLLIHPSMLEGFGYTPIEAAMLKTPVLTSKETALFETTMGLLNYYEPADDCNILARRIKEILCNLPSNEELASIAHLLAQQYDECKQAQKVWKYIQKID